MPNNLLELESAMQRAVEALLDAIALTADLSCDDQWKAMVDFGMTLTALSKQVAEAMPGEIRQAILSEEERVKDMADRYDGISY